MEPWIWWAIAGTIYLIFTLKLLASTYETANQCTFMFSETFRERVRKMESTDIIWDIGWPIFCGVVVWLMAREAWHAWKARNRQARA